MTPSDNRLPRAGRLLVGTEWAVLGLFFLSGASALVYEVVWSRRLTFIFGGTAFAIATVLAAYMAGLAIGSWMFGRRIDRGGHPLVVYSLLEGGIAVWALLLPVLLGGLNGFYGLLYRSIHPGPLALALIRFALSFVVLLVPTILMGGTLPVLSKLLEARSSTVGLKAGLLYGTNTIGAVVGTATTGFILLPTFGLAVSTWVAVGFNLAVMLLGLGLARRIPLDSRAAAEEPAAAPANDGRGAASEAERTRQLALWVYAASGFAALAYEVAWTKVLSGALGTTTYAFSAMLTTFLLGLSIGAFLFARLADRLSPATLLAWSQLTIALIGLVTVPIFGQVPVYFVQAFKAWGSSWGTQTLVRFLLCAATMLPPTILMGAAFPLVTRIYARRGGDLGRRVGELYAANTIGAILGSFAAGFLLIPQLGRQNTILVATAVNLAFAVALYLRLWPGIGRAARLTGLLTALALAIALPGALRPWNQHLMASGAYVYADTYARDPDPKKLMLDQQIVYFHEESEAILAVMRAEHVLSLRTNGKVEASNTGDMLTQKMISHLPLLYHRAPADVCMIGLASGISLGSVLAYPEVKRADCVEMLGGMRTVAGYFKPWNHDCLADPRTNLLINDGRNHLLLTDQTYDVIISQPSNPWIAGITSLFTREFFELGTRRLRPDGVFCQWVQIYQMSRRDFGSVLRTFQDVFPYVTIWTGVPGDIVLVGSRQPLILPWDRLQQRLAEPTVAEDLRSIGVSGAAGLLSGFIGAGESLKQLAAVGGPEVTDDNLQLEFSMPRNLYSSKVEMMDISRLAPVREPLTATIGVTSPAAAEAAGLPGLFRRVFEGRGLTIQGISLGLSGQVGASIPVLEKALEKLPEDPLALNTLSANRNEIAIKLLQGGQTDQALQEFRRVAARGSRSERALAFNNIGLQFFAEGQVDSARGAWTEAARLEPEGGIIRYNLGLALERLGDLAGAIREYRAVLALDPDNAGVANNLAWLLAQEPATAPEAVTIARTAARIDPGANIRDTWGYALMKAGQPAEAEKVLRDALKKDAGNREVRLHLGFVLADLGRSKEARSLLEEAARQTDDPGLADEARNRLQSLK